MREKRGRHFKKCKCAKRGMRYLRKYKRFSLLSLSPIKKNDPAEYLSNEVSLNACDVTPPLPILYKS